MFGYGDKSVRERIAGTERHTHTEIAEIDTITKKSAAAALIYCSVYFNQAIKN